MTACPPRPYAFLAGLPIGCVGMGVLALWQVWGLSMERALGYTNAIQWGNLALLLACLIAVSLAVTGQLLDGAAIDARRLVRGRDAPGVGGGRHGDFLEVL